jgi:uncharacterized cupredoxin-like copper-binding protein
MAPITTPPQNREPQAPPPPRPPLDYQVAEGFGDGGHDNWRERTTIALVITGLIAVVAVIVALFSLADDNGGNGGATTTPAPAATGHTQTAAAAPAAFKPGPTLAESKGVKFEAFKPVDATLPAVPAGAVKKFTVDVMQHVTQVAPDLAPTEAWTYVINGRTHRGTAASSPIVVNQGDTVQITFVNGGSKAMKVTMPHSIDFHSAEVAPNKYYVDVAAGKKLVFSFVAKHPGVFMYHCATQPVLWHTSNGMAGMMVVKPKNLPKVDRELWITQSEYYLGKPGAPADMDKMAAETPDVIAFNGYANQYKANPIPVRKGEKIRMYVLNEGPSKWSAFHVIGTVFDTTTIEGMVGHDSQTVNLAPSQGGWVDFTLDQEGNFPFVTHSFGDMARGAAGILHTQGAPKVKAPAPAKAATGGTAAAEGFLGVTLGEMFVKTSSQTIKAGHVDFNVSNTGATMHQFAIGRAPLQMQGAEPAQSAALAKGTMLQGGAKETVHATLKPGKYVLYCLVSGHYAAGQHSELTVTK